MDGGECVALAISEIRLAPVGIPDYELPVGSVGHA